MFSVALSVQPGLNLAVPDVIRHTALRSSDFPLPAPEDAGSGRPVRLPTNSLYVDAGCALDCGVPGLQAQRAVPLHEDAVDSAIRVEVPVRLISAVEAQGR